MKKWKEALLVRCADERKARTTRDKKNKNLLVCNSLTVMKPPVLGLKLVVLVIPLISVHPCICWKTSSTGALSWGMRLFTGGRTGWQEAVIWVNKGSVQVRGDSDT